MHTEESNTEAALIEFLEAEYGPEAVDSQVYLPESTRYCDIVVDLPVATLCIEVESRFSAAIKGVGQALLYAAHYRDGVPVVVLPADHTESPEMEMLQGGAAVIKEFDAEAGEFVQEDNYR